MGLNAVVSPKCWAGMAGCWVGEHVLEAAAPIDRGKWHTVSILNQVPSQHGLPRTWEAKEF